MNIFRAMAAGVLLAGMVGIGQAAQISGEYIETRSCDVYTGPCFANGQIGLTGREAMLAWKVDKGSWNGVSLKDLGVVLVVAASDTLGTNNSFATKPDPVRAVILVDSRADAKQKEALVAFVKDSARNLTKDVIHVGSAPITLTNDHLSGKGHLVVGKIARIESRGVAKGDCVCTNEEIFYPPLTNVQNFQPAFALNSTYEGDGLKTTWTTLGTRSAFLATFRK